MMLSLPKEQVVVEPQAKEQKLMVFLPHSLRWNFH